MTDNPHNDRLEMLARHLSFNVYDIEAANRCFADWNRTRSAHLKTEVDLWIYLYVTKYYLAKFATLSHAGACDFDALVEKAFRRILSSIESVRDPRRFASWTSVICRRQFCNYLRSKKVATGIDPDEFADEELSAAVSDVDTRVLIAAAHGCIDKLQPFLRRVAELRYLQDHSYEEIAELLNKDVSTVRAYAHKAIEHMRRDPAIRVFMKDRATDEEMRL